MDPCGRYSLNAPFLRLKRAPCRRSSVSGSFGRCRVRSERKLCQRSRIHHIVQPAHRRDRNPATRGYYLRAPVLPLQLEQSDCLVRRHVARIHVCLRVLRQLCQHLTRFRPEFPVHRDPYRSTRLLPERRTDLPRWNSRTVNSASLVGRMILRWMSAEVQTLGSFTVVYGRLEGARSHTPCTAFNISQP